MGHQNWNPKKGKKGEQKKWEKKPFSANKIKPEKIVIFVLISKKIQNNVLFSEYSKYNELMMNTRLE